MTKKKKLISLLFIGITGISLLLYFHINDLRCLLIPRSQNFTISQNKNVTIYTSIDTPKDTLQILHEVIKEGVKSNELFWEKQLEKAVVIYCHNNSLYQKYGLKGFPAVTRLGTYVVIPSTGLSREILGHEFCHTQMYNNLDREYWTYYYQLPCWFDEGLALQFNNYGIYSSESLSSIKTMSLAELQKIDRVRNFYVNDPNQLLKHYAASKIEIRNWLNKHSKEELFKVIEAFKNGRNFYKVYSHSQATQ